MVTSILRRSILGKKDKFLFKRYREGSIDFDSIKDGIGLYVHIPFCSSICPYCPYNKILYDKRKADLYKGALMKEIDMFRDRVGNKKISSLYFGGGTPGLLVDEIGELVDYIRENYGFNGDIGIELHPKGLSPQILGQLKEMGVNMISLGVQTFREDILKFLGRDYGIKDIEEAINLIKSYEFQCVDIDIMTNLPNQSLEDIERDVKKAYSYGVDQLSIYPLIVFPMTKLDKIIRDNQIIRFSGLEERKILQVIDSISEKAAYKRTSIWTYSKDRKNRYSSVTRENFIGFGAGASSHFDNYFYLNTFNVDAYIEALDRGDLAINLVNYMTDREKMIFWIFWRSYDGLIEGDRFKVLFKKDMEEEFKLLFFLFKFLNMAKKKGDKYILTERGRFAYHLVEKQYSIHYLNYLWERSMLDPWIQEVRI